LVFEYELYALCYQLFGQVEPKEQIEAKFLGKYEAAMRREKALAYTFTHHQQNWKYLDL